MKITDRYDMLILSGMIATICLIMLIISHQPKKVVITDDDHGGCVKIHVHDRIEIMLTDPGTGHVWTFTELDRNILIPLPDSTAPETSAPYAKKITRSSLRAVAPGRACIRLALQRPWLKKTEPVRTFEFTVLVK